jgi:hypothetical protein
MSKQEKENPNGHKCILPNLRICSNGINVCGSCSHILVFIFWKRRGAYNLKRLIPNFLLLEIIKNIKTLSIAITTLNKIIRVAFTPAPIIIGIGPIKITAPPLTELPSNNIPAIRSIAKPTKAKIKPEISKRKSLPNMFEA